MARMPSQEMAEVSLFREPVAMNRPARNATTLGRMKNCRWKSGNADLVVLEGGLFHEDHKARRDGQ